MGDSKWRVEDVLDYFEMELEEVRKLLGGKYGDRLKVACTVMILAEKEIVSEVSYFQKMNKVRDILIELGTNPPFRSVYRRAK
jgi:hypothetical protein